MTNEIEGLVSVIKSCDTVQFATHGDNLYPETRTIANFLNKDRNITKELILFFLTNRNTHKIQQIRKDDNVSLYYFNPETRKAITLFGIVEEIKNPDIRKSFWQDGWKKFGYDDINDPNYVVMKFIAKKYKYYTNGTTEHNGDI